jgi:uncharacterized damage-inducible protein DinB
MNLLLQQWMEARTRFTKQLPEIGISDLAKKLAPDSNSIGFLIEHIAEVELLFAKNVFGLKDIDIRAKTVIAGKDTGQWTDLDQLMKQVEYAEQKLVEAISSIEDWAEIIETKEFGKKTKAEALGRIISHTAYHAGQIALIKKYC